MVAQTRRGDVEGALQTAASMQPDESHRGHLIVAIVEAQAESGDIKGALQNAKTLNNIYEKTEALEKIAAAQSEKGDVKGALKWATRLTSPLEKAHALLGVAKGILKIKGEQGVPFFVTCKPHCS